MAFFSQAGCSVHEAALVSRRDVRVCPCSYVRSDPGEARVGSRKRARPVVVADPGQLSDGRGTIPLERSLVLSVDSSLDDL